MNPGHSCSPFDASILFFIFLISLRASESHRMGRISLASKPIGAQPSFDHLSPIIHYLGNRNGSESLGNVGNHSFYGEPILVDQIHNFPKTVG